jgi:GxxExxY protein
MKSENELATIIIGCAIEVHRNLGPGLLEKTYRECLFYELQKSGLSVEKEKTLPLVYKDVHLEQGFRMDIVVEKKVVIEIKTVEAFNDVHLAQLLTYLKFGEYRLGLLLNFYANIMKTGIKRVIK